ncbi:SUMF1/EgtB/PvdO family nonheme iron enzyme [Parvicella tangerina]|uniref:Sulfatase-modifying factor enzyme-like domain-containing protein n=1 Tax=Parvicella tangerina TaxID=2829795 RepID=A0A916JMU8_9FLAO|nr:SUMF1/EgtB/PvdO family nonheme iron enzyme [Parvicella tangerina]CAG5081508.1 hypothetical protein CRYO30217_01650 [Parvicella tangerina]
MRQLFSILFCIIIGGSGFSQDAKEKDILNDYSLISENLYISVYELSIGEYQNYLSAIAQDSTEEFYKSQLPDSTALDYIRWANESYCGCGPMYIPHYSHPAFDNMPAYGLSHDQVINYCNWLTSTSNDSTGLIEYKFRLPSEDEWDSAYGKNSKKYSKDKEYCETYVSDYPAYGNLIRQNVGLENVSYKRTRITNSNNSDKGEFIYKDSIYVYDLIEPNCYSRKPQPNPIWNNVVNEYGLFHIDGNLSEMTSTPGIAKGSSYILQKDFGTKAVVYEKPEPWLGARLICEKITNPNKD